MKIPKTNMISSFLPWCKAHTHRQGVGVRKGSRACGVGEKQGSHMWGKRWAWLRSCGMTGMRWGRGMAKKRRDKQNPDFDVIGIYGILVHSILRQTANVLLLWIFFQKITTCHLEKKKKNSLEKKYSITATCLGLSFKDMTLNL